MTQYKLLWTRDTLKMAKIEPVLLDLADSKNEVDWNMFVEEMASVIIRHHDNSKVNEYKGIWKRMFKEGLTKLNLTLSPPSQRSYDAWKEKIVPKLNISSSSSFIEPEPEPEPELGSESGLDNNHQSESGIQKQARPRSRSKTATTYSTNTTTSTTSSLNYQKELTADDIALFTKTKESLNNKWTLKSGKKVEDVLYDSAREYNYEHPYHSFIISLGEDDLSEMFDSEEIKELEEAGSSNDLDLPLPQNLADILKNLNNKKTFEDIDKCFQAMMFDRRQQPDEYWCRESVLNYLNLFYNSDSVRVFKSEIDLLDEMYGFIKSSQRISNTITETVTSSASSCENKNSKRDIGSVYKVARQVSGELPDLVFKFVTTELACVEIGLEDHGRNGTKELNERRMKLPKMMRSFCSRIIEQYETEPSSIKIVGFIISGPNITAKIMTFKYGSIGLVSSSRRLKMPETISQMARMLPRVLRLVYNCAQIIKSNTVYLEKLGATDCADSTDNYFPPSFIPATIPVNTKNKKRKSTSL